MTKHHCRKYKYHMANHWSVSRSKQVKVCIGTDMLYVLAVWLSEVEVRQMDCLVLQSFERSMKFAFEEPHVWMQYALSLVSMGHYAQALAVFKIVARLLPTKVMPCLFAARICYQHLNQVGTHLSVAFEL